MTCCDLSIQPQPGNCGALAQWTSGQNKQITFHSGPRARGRWEEEGQTTLQCRFQIKVTFNENKKATNQMIVDCNRIIFFRNADSDIQGVFFSLDSVMGL